MYARGPGGTGDGVGGFRTEDLAGGGHELHKHLRGGGRRRGLEVMARRDQGPLERGRERQRRETARQRLQPPPVVAAGHG